ncbi:sugar ABC transporter ATP-binding protein [Oscillospiraceae bacterium PP1C4]
MGDIIFEVKNVNKRFGATQALRDVSLTIEAGTIHSLLGRNGAGKSTVVNIIAGIYPQDGGKVLYCGSDISEKSVFERQKMGIRMVTQHASVIPDLTIAENIFMGLWPKKKGFVDWETMYTLAEAELKQYGLEADPRAKVKTLGNVDMRKINIVRAMYGGAKLVILDEPTTALSSKERDDLFIFINKLKEQGTAFIFISHYLDEVVRLSDQITVIRDGLSFAGSDGSLDVSEERLANLIAGEDVELKVREKHKTLPDSKIALECVNVGGDHLSGTSFKLYKGQILGVIGFPGSGAREICRTLFGLEKMKTGEVRLFDGNPVRLSSPEIALKNGIAYISHDRHGEGIVAHLNILENISLPIMKTVLRSRWGLIEQRKAIKVANQYSNMLKVKCNTIYDKLSSLSGGNQQKVVVAKTLSSMPSIMILDEPTVGIDIKSREEIITIVNDLTEEVGMSVLYLTNDFDELIRIADRLIFFRDGRLVGDVDNENLTHEDVVRMRDTLNAAN